MHSQESILPLQCDPTDVLTPSDILFLGAAKTVTAGNITFSYHDFGPLSVDEAPLQEDEILTSPESDLSSSTTSTDSPALVLVHGFASTQYDWPFALLEELAHSRRVIIFDNPRIGASVDASNDTLSIDYMANATVGLTEALGLVKPHLMGISMGGSIVLTAAALHPDKIGSVVSSTYYNMYYTTTFIRKK